MFEAWQEFKRGKENKLDVQDFARDLEDNIFDLHKRLVSGSYRHGEYEAFLVRDPKLRNIHKASVSDRVLHHAMTNMLSPLFEPVFIHDSYSSRKEKGLHRACQRWRSFAWQLSRNNTRTVWVLKCDIKKYFASVDHGVLMELLVRKIRDKKIVCLLADVIGSFDTGYGQATGIPLGNLTSQLFSNVYLDPLDQWLKRSLHIKYYVRYADDFIILDPSPVCLASLIPKIEAFLGQVLHLQLHPEKIDLSKWHQGIDFLGYVSFPHYSVLRTSTKWRMLRRIQEKTPLSAGRVAREKKLQMLASYRGLLSHCRSRHLRKIITKTQNGSKLKKEV